MKLVRTLSMIIALAGVPTAHADTPPAKVPAEKGARPSPPPSDDTILEFIKKTPELEPLTKLDLRGYCTRYSLAMKSVIVAAHVRKTNKSEVFILRGSKLVKGTDSERKLLVEEALSADTPDERAKAEKRTPEEETRATKGYEEVKKLARKTPEFEPMTKLNLKGYCTRYSPAVKSVILVVHIRKTHKPEIFTLKGGKLTVAAESERKLLFEDPRENNEEWLEEGLDRAQ